MATAKQTLIGLLAGAALFAACGSDSEEASPDKDTPSFTSEDASTEEEEPADAGETTDAKAADASSTETDAASTNAADAGCRPEENADGFYLCTPETNIQFLNQFVEESRGIAQVSFDNTARIPGYVAGKLPALP
ncbi:MAG: hypothetical protein RL385_5690 [Pseudomonadota bacterium]|jgi:hypothetical protein